MDVLKALETRFHDDTQFIIHACVCPVGRVSPSEGDSVVSDHSSERGSTGENQRGHATPGNGKPPRKVPINVLNGEQPRQRSSNHREPSREQKGSTEGEGRKRGGKRGGWVVRKQQREGGRSGGGEQLELI